MILTIIIQLGFFDSVSEFLQQAQVSIVRNLNGILFDLSSIGSLNVTASPRNEIFWYLNPTYNPCLCV